MPRHIHAQPDAIVVRKSLKRIERQLHGHSSFTDPPFAFDQFRFGFEIDTFFFTHALEFVLHAQFVAVRRHARGGVRGRRVRLKMAQSSEYSFSLTNGRSWP